MAFIPRSLKVRSGGPTSQHKRAKIVSPKHDNPITPVEEIQSSGNSGRDRSVAVEQTTLTTKSQSEPFVTPSHAVMSSPSISVTTVQTFGSDSRFSGDSDVSSDEEVDNEPIVSFCKDQRMPLPGEPVCVVCGRYGAYICDSTSDDVCSLECKAKLLYDKGEGLSTSYRPDMLTSSKQESQEDISSPLTPVQANELRNEMKIEVKGEAIPPPIVDFKQFIADQKLLANLTDLDIVVPTPVQMQVIPCAYSQRDMLVCANTGSGKTLSFLLPVIKKLNLLQAIKPTALILAPVRELCVQTEEVAKTLMRGLPNMRTALLVGGLPIANQIHRLKQQVQILVATPARLLDVITHHKSDVDLSGVSVVILDEADTLLELGFEPQVHEVLQAISSNRQTLLFSATIPKKIEGLAKNLLHAPITVTVGEPFLPAEGIRHIVLWESETLKKKRLFTILRDPKLFNPPIVVFVTSRAATLLLAEAIDKTLDVATMAVHGDMPQDRRMKILKDFKENKYSILVATGGLVGRGMDLPHCKQVIVFDFPSSVHEYIHQIGRCSRLGSTGTAVTFINDTNKKLFLKLVKILEPVGTRLPLELTSSPHLRDQMERQSFQKKTKSGRELDIHNQESLMAMVRSKSHLDMK